MQTVYCMMITQPGREHFAAQAIADFHAQTYPHKQLVRIDDPKNGMTIGELRNRALVRIPMDGLVAIWDDDDRHHPDRLAFQADILLKLQANAILLNNILIQCTCGAVFESLHTGTPHPTLLAQRNKMPRYPPVQYREDTIQIEELHQRHGKLFRVDNPPHLYTKRYHGTNITMSMLSNVQRGHVCASNEKSPVTEPATGQSHITAQDA